MMCAYTHWRPLSILPPLPLLHDITDNETPPTPVGLTKSHTLHLHEVKRRSVSQSTIHHITRVLHHQQWMCQPWAMPCTYQLVVLSPDLPSTLQEEREYGEYCTTFLYLQNFSCTIWLADLAIIPAVLGFLSTNHLSLPHHTFQFTEAQQDTSKGLAISGIHTNTACP